MTDYQEEQTNEIEALESIYPEELTILSVEPYHCFEMTIQADYMELDVGVDCSATLQFTYTEKYPDEPPLMAVSLSENLEDEQIEQILELMKNEANENLGMSHVFAMVQASQEWLSNFVEADAKRRRLEQEQAIEEAEEAERKRFEGKRVTIESFLAWKAMFDAEMAELKKKKGNKEDTSNRLTGKELFMSDRTLDDSDVKFLEEDGDTVQVDESLFQDLDDLEIGDDELDES